MTMLTVKIDKERDLPVLEALLSRLGLKYEIGEKGDWGNLSVAETEGIEHGLADMNAGRGYADEDVKAFINNKLKDFRMING